MKRSIGSIFLAFVFLAVLLSGCAPASTLFTPTNISVPTAMPTKLPTVTPAPFMVRIDPATSYTEWSADVQARFHDVVTAPTTATEAQKQAYDAYITTQWQLTLKEAGVPNPEALKGYKLLGAIVEYTKTNKVHEVAPLPFALQLQIVSDKDNLVEFGVGKDLSPNERPSYFGYMWNASGHWTADIIRADAMLFFPTMHFYGQEIKPGSSGSFNMTGKDLEGDLVLRFHLQGVDPNVSQGGLIRMVDQSGNMRYATVVLNYRATETTNQQDCITLSGNQLSGGVCTGGDALKQTRMHLVSEPTNHHDVTPEVLDDIMDQTGNSLHIAMYSYVGTGQLQYVYNNGSAVIKSFEIGFDVAIDD